MIDPHDTSRDDQRFEDRRLFARFRAGVLLRCSENRSRFEDRYQRDGATIDLSAQGIGGVASEWVRPSSEVEIFLKVPGSGEEFLTTGKVVWCQRVGKQYRFGISLEKPELMLVSQLMIGGTGTGN